MYAIRLLTFHTKRGRLGQSFKYFTRTHQYFTGKIRGHFFQRQFSNPPPYTPRVCTRHTLHTHTRTKSVVAAAFDASPLPYDVWIDGDWLLELNSISASVIRGDIAPEIWGAKRRFLLHTTRFPQSMMPTAVPPVTTPPDICPNAKNFRDNP